MPIPSPILDDRSYQQLRDELVRRIPVYTPEWTDHNASDPGVTLLELFAFLGENLLFRFNQIPEATKLAFLRLLQVPLRPAAPARAMVALTTEQPDGALVPLGSEVKAGNVSFQTRTEVQVWPVSFTTVARAKSPAPDPQKEPEVHEFALRALDALGPLAAGEEAVYYQNQTVPPDGNGLPVNFDATVDGMLWVAVLQEKGADPGKLPAALLNLGFVPDPFLAKDNTAKACPGANAIPAAPQVEWQVSTKKPDANGKPVYAPVVVEGDTTRGLSQEGVVRLRLPAGAVQLGLPPVTDPDALGTGDLPPALDDQATAKLLFWLRAYRPDQTRFGNVQYVGANAAEVLQVQKARPEFLGTGTGQPNQHYRLVHRPVIEGSLIVEVEEASGWQRWQAIDSFHASGPNDRVYVVDLEAGEVRFGSAVQGWPPQIGQRIRAVEYLYGGGLAGNVPAKAISKLAAVPVGLAPAVKVSNPLRAHGGSAAEGVEEAVTRIPGELRRHDRAVTASDFQELALATPGADVGRAECLPRFHAPSRTPEWPGAVSVVVWPREDPQHPNAPLPDRNLLRAVCEWLDRRRLVTTELYVIPPAYRKVAVAVGLRVKPGYGIEAVHRWVELVIRQYLAPLPPYGPDGGGWPLGRRVHGPELEAAALQVEGVEYLESLKVAGMNDAGQWIPGSVDLASYEVPELAAITVEDGPPTVEPGGSLGPPPSATVPVPVPILRQEC
jgi:hypothetical protein